MDGLATLLLVLVVIGLLALTLVVWALVVAIRREDWAWVVALAISVLALGVIAPIVAVVYLVTYRKNGPTPAKQGRFRRPVEEGWYPDPGAEFDQRWWDGATWTDQVMDDGIARTRPLPAEGRRP
ncbi:MAG: DUF2510 domain-containing protein [Actinomycetota bacterium]